MNTKKILLVTLISILVATQCKKKDENLCKDQVPFKTDFGIFIKTKYSRAQNGDTIIEIKNGDTCLTDYINFIAKENQRYTVSYDSVKWVVGNAQNTSNLQEYQSTFSFREYNIPVSLTGYKRRNFLNCFPLVEDVQTVTKTFSVVEPNNLLPIAGNFFGYNIDSPTDTFSISTGFEPKRNWFVIKNFPKGNKGFPYGVLPPPIDSFVGIHPNRFGFDYILIDNENGAIYTPNFGPLYGVAKIINRNQIEINYQQFMVKDAQGYWINPKQRKFVGIRKL